MSALSSLRENGGIPLQVLPPPTGRLWSNSVVQVIKAEDQYLLSMLETKRFLCVSYTMRRNDFQINFPPLNVHRKLRVLLPNMACIIAIMAIFVTVCVLLPSWQRGQYKYEMGALLILLFAIASCWLSFNVYFLGKESVQCITERREILASFFGQYHRKLVLIPPQKLLGLVSKFEFREETLKSLINLASVGEWMQLVDKTNAFGRRLLARQPSIESYDALYSLLFDAPDDINRYRECLIRAGAFLKTNDDYEVLRRVLPPGDPRLGVLTIPDNVPNAPPANNDIVIEIIPIEKIVIELSNEVIQVDIQKLKEQSTWFAAHLSGRFGPASTSRIKLSSSDPYQLHLAYVLTQLNGPYNSLWEPIETARLNHLFERVECVTFYGFNNITAELSWSLFNSGLLTTSDQIKMVQLVIGTNGITDANRNKWVMAVFDQLKKEPLDEADFKIWFEFSVKHFRNTVIQLYNGYLIGNSEALTPQRIQALFPYKEFITQAWRSIEIEVWLDFENPNEEQALYVKNKEFALWCAQFMHRKWWSLLTINRFKWLWQDRDWRAIPGVTQALIDFASEPKNRNPVMELWPIGEVPSDLMQHLHR